MKHPVILQKVVVQFFYITCKTRDFWQFGRYLTAPTPQIRRRSIAWWCQMFSPDVTQGARFVKRFWVTARQSIQSLRAWRFRWWKFTHWVKWKRVSHSFPVSPAKKKQHHLDSILESFWQFFPHHFCRVFACFMDFPFNIPPVQVCPIRQETWNSQLARFLWRLCTLGHCQEKSQLVSTCQCVEKLRVI